ncbi:hypothetical protein [Lysobacter rhizosphaerae]
MWPFKKRQKSQPTGSFQEFMRTYAPPEPKPVEDPFDVETVCPLCADLFPPDAVPKAYPFCPDCSSEGIDFEVQPLKDFLGGKSVDDFDDMLTRWESAEGFRPEYKLIKSNRIRHLKALKLAGR